MNGNQYERFGVLLRELRLRAGIAHQADLATLMATSQQTVSRWEAGESRPRAKQLPLLAEVLRANSVELLEVAGYAQKTTITSFDRPLPIEALSPEGFERFCAYFLDALYSEAEVHAAGSQGHTQEGIDIDVLFPNRTRYTFQCKRVEEFGPRKVHAAVAAHTTKARKKFLLLSRIASPQARAAIRRHRTWDIWDKEDISRVFRGLAKQAQIRLVDTFFAGQRFDLLGETKGSPWQTREEFFRPFSVDGAFSHAWSLVGRASETAQLVGALSDPEVRLALLVGAAGSGKTRVLKHALEAFSATSKSVLLRILSQADLLEGKDLEELGQKPKVLVVDDAHDRNDLALLFQYAATNDDVKVVLTLRPYGLDLVKSQASNFSLFGKPVREVRLSVPSVADATELAKQVLIKLSGPIEAAKEIASHTFDCPLATVMGAQIVAKERLYFEFVKNEMQFRTKLISRFQDVITGNIGAKGDTDIVKKLLPIVALLQPFDPEEHALLTIAEKIEGLRSHEVSKGIKLLIEAGILFRRGGAYRLSPDVLADFVLENECVGATKKSTGYAERAFDHASDSQIGRVLLNLGKLDWRLSDGNPSDSQLLDGLWRKLRPSQEYADPYIRAVAAVAFYQPARALNFVEGLLQKQKHLRELPRIARNAAYSLRELPRACPILWELGCNDDRQLHSTPDHGIRILAELCSVRPNKPLEYNEVVVDFGLSLLDRSDAWGGVHTPFDVLHGLLEPEGHTTTSHSRRTISFDHFVVDPTKVSNLRGRVVDAALAMLTHTNIRAAVLAAKTLQEALRYPIRSAGQTLGGWQSEFVRTLKKIVDAIARESIDPLVLIELSRAAHLRAEDGKDIVAKWAKRIQDSIPRSLPLRTMIILMGAYNNPFKRFSAKISNEEWSTELKAIAAELSVEYPDAEVRREFFERTLAHMDAGLGERDLVPQALYWTLIDASPEFVCATIENAEKEPTSKTAQFSGMTLGKLLREDHPQGLKIARRFLKSGRLDLLIAIGDGYAVLGNEDRRYIDDDIEILQTVLRNSQEGVVGAGIEALRVVAKTDTSLALLLLCNSNLAISSRLADRALGLLAGGHDIPFDLLDEAKAELLLGKLRLLPQLDGHWIETFLSSASRVYASIVAQFFMHRVEHAAETKDWGFRPCNHGPYRHVPLQFRKSLESTRLLHELYQWMKSSKGSQFQALSTELFSVMFGPFDVELVDFFEARLAQADKEDIKCIAQILRETRPMFVVQQMPFVVRFLDVARTFGQDVLERASRELYGAAVYGERSGTAGEPFPRDLEMKAGVEKILPSVPRFSPAYRLYEDILKDAEKHIDDSKRDAEAFED